MTNIKQAQKINADIVEWPIDPEIRAANILAWCNDNGIITTLTKQQLMVAMDHMPYWQQGPANYLDFVLAYESTKALAEERN